MSHLDSPGTYSQLFVDFNSTFNIIIPGILHPELSQFSVPTPTCNWITSFFINKEQQVKLGEITSSNCTFSTSNPQECMLSPLLFSISINDCTSWDSSVKILKFADDTTVSGLIQDGDESAYRQEVERLALCCRHNNLELNTSKTFKKTLFLCLHS